MHILYVLPAVTEPLVQARSGGVDGSSSVAVGGAGDGGQPPRELACRLGPRPRRRRLQRRPRVSRVARAPASTAGAASRAATCRCAAHRVGRVARRHRWHSAEARSALLTRKKNSPKAKPPSCRQHTHGPHQSALYSVRVRPLTIGYAKRRGRGGETDSCRENITSLR